MNIGLAKRGSGEEIRILPAHTDLPTDKENQNNNRDGKELFRRVERERERLLGLGPLNPGPSPHFYEVRWNVNGALHLFSSHSVGANGAMARERLLMQIILKRLQYFRLEQGHDHPSINQGYNQVTEQFFAGISPTAIAPQHLLRPFMHQHKPKHVCQPIPNDHRRLK